MSKALGAVLAAALSLVSVTTASPASAAPRETGPRPVTQLLPTVQPNRPQGITVRWKTDRRVCDVKIRVWGNRNVRVSYPGRRDFVTFAEGDDLRPGRTDTTVFRVTAGFDRPVWAILAATITYDHCGRNAPTLTKNTGLLLPVAGRTSR